MIVLSAGRPAWSAYTKVLQVSRTAQAVMTAVSIVTRLLAMQRILTLTDADLGTLETYAIAEKLRVLIGTRDLQPSINARATRGFTGRADHPSEWHSDRHGH